MRPFMFFKDTLKSDDVMLCLWQKRCAFGAMCAFGTLRIKSPYKRRIVFTMRLLNFVKTVSDFCFYKYKTKTRIVRCL